MPGTVIAARLCMLIQAALGLLAVLLFIGGDFTGSGGALMLMLFVPGLVILLAIGVLGIAARSRAPWIRIAAFALEGLIIVNSAYAIVRDGVVGVSEITILALPVVVVILLATPTSGAWFKRP